MLPILADIVKKQNNLTTLKTWIGDINADAPFDGYGQVFTVEMMSKLKTLCIGFNRSFIHYIID